MNSRDAIFYLIGVAIGLWVANLLIQPVCHTVFVPYPRQPDPAPTPTGDPA